MATSIFRVFIDDNFHYMDESYRLTRGVFDTPDEAVEYCKRVVDEWLEENHRPGMAAGELYGMYKMFGEDPFIKCDGPTPVRFSAWGYAKEQCEELCRSSESQKDGTGS